MESPGGDIPLFEVERFERGFIEAHANQPEDIVLRLARTYGSRAERILDGDLGEDFGGGLHAREVDYLVANEWARSAQDIL